MDDVTKLKTIQSSIKADLADIKLKLSDDYLEKKISSSVRAALVDHPVPQSVAKQQQVSHHPQYDFVQSQEFRRIVYDESREIAERDRRRQSVVIKGLGADIRTLPGAFEDLTSSLLGVGVKIIDVVCINQQMVRAKILNDEHRKEILKEAKKLKNTESYKNVYINRDLTKKQRLLLSEARARTRTAHPVVSGSSGTSPLASGANAIPIGLRMADKPPTTRLLPGPADGDVAEIGGRRAMVQTSNPTVAPVVDVAPPVDAPFPQKSSDPLKH